MDLKIDANLTFPGSGAYLEHNQEKWWKTRSTERSKSFQSIVNLQADASAADPLAPDYLIIWCHDGLGDFRAGLGWSSAELRGCSDLCGSTRDCGRTKLMYGFIAAWNDEVGSKLMPFWGSGRPGECLKDVERPPGCIFGSWCKKWGPKRHQKLQLWIHFRGPSDALASPSELHGALGPRKV